LRGGLPRSRARVRRRG